jgi:hypothetical protein
VTVQACAAELPAATLPAGCGDAGVTVHPSGAARVIGVAGSMLRATAGDCGRAADELKEKGFSLLHDVRTEPWGQTVARLQSSEGAIIGISYTPWLHS